MPSVSEVSQLIATPRFFAALRMTGERDRFQTKPCLRRVTQPAQAGFVWKGTASAV